MRSRYLSKAKLLQFTELYHTIQVNPHSLIVIAWRTRYWNRILKYFNLGLSFVFEHQSEEVWHNRVTLKFLTFCILYDNLLECATISDNFLPISFRHVTLIDFKCSKLVIAIFEARA